MEEGLVGLGDKVGVNRRCSFDNGRQEARDLIDVSSLRAPSANVLVPTAFFPYLIRVEDVHCGLCA